jgi:hypothetical protein
MGKNCSGTMRVEQKLDKHKNRFLRIVFKCKRKECRTLGQERNCHCLHRSFVIVR